MTLHHIPFDTKTDLLFIDESDARSTTGVVALTGVLVEASKYPGLRDDFYTRHRLLFPEEPNSFNLSPPEYHACELFKEMPPGLPEATDEHRLQAHRDVVALCNAHRLPVVRRVYTNGKEIEKLAPGASRAMCFFGMSEMLYERLKERLVIPIMDLPGRKEQQSLSGSVRNGDILRAFMPPTVNVDHVRATNNLIGEVFYAVSTYSFGVQLADMIGYMLNARDCVERGIANTYKATVAAITGELNADLLTTVSGPLGMAPIVPSDD